jgi:hypothetical protein
MTGSQLPAPFQFAIVLAHHDMHGPERSKREDQKRESVKESYH